MLIDSFGRSIDYIRVSVTKNCNFRCLYCMPDTPDEIKENLIPLNQMLEFLKIAMDLGVRKVRLTGGEPLLRGDLSEFVRGIYSYKNDVEVALTTNGFLLKKYAKELKNAGLKRINVSLDSLQSHKISTISKKNDALDSILEGIFLAKNVGLGVKINMVPLKNINENEIIDLLEFANKNGFLIRYIEYMDNTFAKSGIVGLRSEEILKIIDKKYRYKMLQKEHFGPAKLYEIEGLSGESKALDSINSLDSAESKNLDSVILRDSADLKNSAESWDSVDSKNLDSASLIESNYSLDSAESGDFKNLDSTDSTTNPSKFKTTKKPVFGIIAPHNDEFCLSCNRIRLSAEGIIFPCLYFEDAVDASVAIRSGDKIAMKEALLKSICNKPEKNKWGENERSNRAFYHTGG
ncbi:hypothetical protein CCY99_03575 [Helicobacter sp. 16-1353]|uniref:GTP 3',8-cyclase MoaA n=1 Tax=Helicobacter sp. 16-1353 TaxID=2004996 RepID=UPI000DCC0F69|nr:GTP 3',8-cyclase MoaA [Helicobacter sp. 16-1353]RAX54440.1 hypothetical protein CCY99_03575 [Helicobacter sp. 16-1353]